MDIMDLNHVALHVKDINASASFYREKIGLLGMPRPDFSFPGAWFRIGSAQELHLIAGRELAVVAGQRGTHFALQVNSVDEAWDLMVERGLQPFSRQRRPDGAFQFYVTDLDGHVIEFCQIDHLHG